MNGRILYAVIVIVAASAVSPAAETLESVQREIEGKLDRLKSVQARLSLEQIVEFDGIRQVGRTEGTYEIVNRGLQSPFRSDMQMTETLSKPGGKPLTRQAKVLTIYDGKHVYVLQEEQGRKTAQKLLFDPKFAIFGDRRFLRVLANDFNLTLREDELTDGTPAWVIRASPKDAGTRPYVETDHHFQKATGLWVKAVARNQDRKIQMMTRITDIKINREMPSERFEFRPPAGVAVVDMTTAAQPARSDAGAPQAAPAPPQR